MSGNSERIVIGVRAREGTEYETVAGILRLNDELSYGGLAGVVLDAITGLPAATNEGSWQIWIGKKENLSSVSELLTQTYGLTVEETDL